MFRDRVYTKTIGLLKIALPLLALVSLSTMFLLSKGSRPSLDLPFLTGQGGLEERLGAPYYTSVTAQGHELRMVADNAQPVEDNVTKAFDVRADMNLTSGRTVHLTSPTALLRETEETVLLDGGVHIYNSTGYTLDTQTLTASTTRTEAESHGFVVATGPKGTLEAGKMHVLPAENGEDLQYLFSGGVRTVYLRVTEERDTE